MIAFSGGTATGHGGSLAMDLGSWIEIGAALLVAALVIAVPVVITIGLIQVAFRRMSGRRGPFDRLFSGLARANAMHWHLNGSGPHPDDVNAVPPAPGQHVRRRRHW
jgi:hypothetical protein